MNNQLYPCLWFDGKAKEAATFYSSVFDNSKIISENPIVVMFELDGVLFMGLNGGPTFKINPSISFFVFCESEEEVEQKWKLLSEGGGVMMALDKYPWNDKYGWCADKYGVNWQLMLGPDAKQKIVPSFMFTQGQSGKAGEAINFYTSLFENSEIQLINRYGKGEGDVEGNINHARFTLNGQEFAGMESSLPHQFTFNEGVSIVVPCDNQEEIDFYWNKLTEGGEESQCGWLKDKYGVSWQIVPAMLGKLINDPEKSKRVMDVVMKSVKFNISELENA
ncbi:VOC family protein [Hanamia caeni]|uniref:VOC family protein n=1 Tax=Hanamia caeni TaxID=2294116 RepID=A0A3M9N7U7_9BACT|nr:VOC family protein [Hanamia caeni]RNI33849.1 VOC family protein [Hanamia caeni]